MYRTIYILILVLLLSVSVSADTTTIQVAASSDDCDFSFTNAFSLTDGIPYFGFVQGNYHTKRGMRFLSVPIPQGSTIDTLLFSYYSAQTLSNDPYIEFWCEDTADATTFTDSVDYNDRTKTTASVVIDDWDTPSTSGNWYIAGATDVNLNTILQEVVNRSDWAEDNDLVIFMESNTATTTNILRSRSYDTFGNTYGCYIYIAWTPPADGVPSVRHSPDGNGVRHSPNGASVRHGG